MLSLTPCIRQKLFSSFDGKYILRLLEKSTWYRLSQISSQSQSSRYHQYSSLNQKQKSEITTSESSSGEVSTTFETVKETTKTVSYTGVIIFGLGVTGIILYTVFRELFSSKSPNSVYSAALDKCINHDKVVISLGEPIKGYGEQTSRGRRRHTSHLLYEKDGVNYLRMKFYIKGSRKKGTVHLEMKENDRGDYEYRYLFVQLDEYPYSTIIIEDNRENTSSVLTGSNDSINLL